MTTTPGMDRPFFVRHHTLPWIDVTVMTDHREALVTLAGEADCANADELAPLITAAAEGLQLMRVDISQLAFLDSSVLRALLICQARLAAQGVEMKVCRPTPQARRIFELTSLTSLLE